MALQYEICPVTHYQQNCSLVWCDQSMRGCFIDPGGDEALLLGLAEKRGVELESILLTHGHLDHVGGAGRLSQQLSVPIIGPHVADQFWFEGISHQCEMFGFAPTESFLPSRWLEEGEQVAVGEEQLQVIHTPGHTPGHVVFYHKERAVAFVGDVIFHGSVGRSDLPQGDHQTLINAIQSKLLILGDEVEFVPGHGPMSSFGYERQHNPYL